MTTLHTPEKQRPDGPAPSLEKRIVASILSRIRESRTDAGSTDAVRLPVADHLPAARLRQATPDDANAVIELKRQWGLIPDPRENWDKLWRTNPALKDADPRRPIGWVLDTDHALVGYIGSVPSTYYWGDEILSAATGHALVVEPGYRATSVALNSAFFRQKYVDLYLGTTAIEAVDKISKIFKCDQLPQPDYDTVLFWILRAQPFADVVAKKLNLGKPASYVAGALGSVALAADKTLRRRWPRRSKSSLEVSAIKPSEIDDDFDQLWYAKRAERKRLLADRSAATLRWHFDIPGDRSVLEVLCCREGRDLQGYMILRHEPAPDNGPRRSIVSDIFVLQDRRDVIENLFVAAYEQSKRAGSHVFEVVGFPQSIRTVLQQWSPYERRFPACPFHFKAAGAAFHQALMDPAVWYAGPYDGDTTLMPAL
jgi:hypothetical protein